MITFDCGECGKTLTVKDETAGRKGTCKFCRASIVVPTPAAESADDAGDEEPAEWLLRVKSAGRRMADGAAVCGRAIARGVSRLRRPKRDSATPPPLPASPGLTAITLLPVEESGDSVACPFCDEPIRKAAKKCRHCGEILDPALRVSPVAPIYQAPPSIIHVNHPPAERPRRWNRGIAMVLSFLIPGLGQMYKGQLFNGLLWLLVVPVGYFCLIIPGLFLHLLCLIGAGMGDETR